MYPLPTIDADANNVACTVSFKSLSDTKSATVAGYFKFTWRSTGLVVVSCCDGDNLHDAKKASCDCRETQQNTTP